MSIQKEWIALKSLMRSKTVGNQSSVWSWLMKRF